MADVNVAILGLERLGTSFGLALKRYMVQKEARHSFSITGFDQRGYNGKTAKQLGAVDNVVRSEADAVAKAHIILLATPYYKTETTYEIMGPSLSPGAVVLDTSPLKLPSLEWANRYLPSESDQAAYMVGVTFVLNPDVLLDPNQEVEGAREDLFDRGTLVLSPAANCPAEAVQLASEVARIIGTDAHFMDPAEHDGLIAATEGIPAVLGASLFRMTYQAEAWDDLRRLANPPFGLATNHLRYQHPDSLWAMLHYNRANTARYLTQLIDTLTAVRDSLNEDEDGAGLEAMLVEGATRYEEWETRRLSNRWTDGDEGSAGGEDFMSSMSGLLLGRRGRGKQDDPTKS